MGWSPGQVASPSPPELDAAAQGFLAQNFDRAQVAGATILVSGTSESALVPLRAGQVVSSVYLACTVVATGLTLAKVGIYSADGKTLLASSANTPAAFAATGLDPIALSAPWTVPATGVYLVVIVCAGTTPPTLLRGNNASSVAPQQLGSNPASFQHVGTGLADLPATPLVFSNSPTLAPWVGLS